LCPADIWVRLQPFAFLRKVFLPAWNCQIIGQAGKQIESPSHVVVFFPGDDLTAAPEDLDFLALKPELLGQTHGLTVS
jgi:hypothetical protein